MNTKKYDKDHMVEPEDVICDGILKAVEELPFCHDFEVNAGRFLDEIHSRSKKVRIDLAFEILNPKTREEFEELMQKLYLKGI